MIITRAPLRMSFVGGGSDMEAYFSKALGRVISVTINKYVYIVVKKKFGGGLRVSYSQTEICNHVDEIKHEIVRECLKLCEIEDGIEIVSMADIPGSGSGLGSSSAFTVALLMALFRFRGQSKSQEEIANLACEVEINRCGAPIGKQDQYASAIGGLNIFNFHSCGSVSYEKYNLADDIFSNINRHLLILYTGKTRSASALLSEQQKVVLESSIKRKTISNMVKLIEPCCETLEQNDMLSFGNIMHKNWMLKKRLTNSISSNWIDLAYEKAIMNGAFGGKIMGAGAGGFFMFISPPNLHNRIACKLLMEQMVVKCENDGCKVIFEA
jgi:D-glycero-alpha-D-manno-heptose-7-phosphate kinase